MATVGTLGVPGGFSTTPLAGSGQMIPSAGAEAAGELGTFMQLLQEAANPSKKSNPLAAALSAFFSPNPAESIPPVKVSKGDDSGYWSALGYNA